MLKVSGVFSPNYCAVLLSLGPAHQCVSLVVILIKIVVSDNRRGSFQVALLRLLKYTQKKTVKLFVADSNSSELRPGKTSYCPWCAPSCC